MRNKVKLTVPLALLIALNAQVIDVSAALIPIANSSFEAPVIPGGQDFAAPIGSWSAFALAGGFVMNNSGTPQRFPGGIPAGSQVGTIQVGAANANNALFQFLGSAFAANTTYTISGFNGFDATGPAGGQSNSGGKLELYGSIDGFASPLVTVDFPGGTAPVGGFQFGSGSFSTGASGGAVGGDILVRIQGYSSPTLLSSSSWDDIQLEETAAIPEPSSLVLLATSLSVCVWRKRNFLR